VVAIWAQAPRGFGDIVETRWGLRRLNSRACGLHSPRIGGAVPLLVNLPGIGILSAIEVRAKQWGY
jgi:hypothetical protein